MDRERLEELVSAYHDEELNAEEKREIETLLEQSAEARTLLSSYQKQTTQISQLLDRPVPDHLEDRLMGAVSTSSQKGGGQNWLWILATVAACFVFFGLSEYSRPEREKFFLSSLGLRLEAPGQEEFLKLPPKGEGTLVLVHNSYRGQFRTGPARLHWRADAGSRKGHSLQAKLSLDFDGDGTYDFEEESPVIEVDDRDGFESLAASFRVTGVVDELTGPGVIKVEFTNHGEHPVEFHFHPESAHLILPTDSLEARIDRLVAAVEYSEP